MKYIKDELPILEFSKKFLKTNTIQGIYNIYRGYITWKWYASIKHLLDHPLNEICVDDHMSLFILVDEPTTQRFYLNKEVVEPMKILKTTPSLLGQETIKSTTITFSELDNISLKMFEVYKKICLFLDENNKNINNLMCKFKYDDNFEIKTFELIYKR